MSDDAVDAEQIPDESEQLDQLQPEDTLVDRDVDDVLDEGYIPPDDWSAAQGYGNTAAEQAAGTTIDQRIKQEVPDRGVDGRDDDSDGDIDAADPDAAWIDREVGDARAGRLVDTTAGGIDDEAEMIADDVGIDGAAASAEEAAMHIVEES